jgi:hypothetical protein
MYASTVCNSNNLILNISLLISLDKSSKFGSQKFFQNFNILYELCHVLSRLSIIEKSSIQCIFIQVLLSFISCLKEGFQQIFDSNNILLFSSPNCQSIQYSLSILVFAAISEGLYFQVIGSGVHVK